MELANDLASHPFTYHPKGARKKNIISFSPNIDYEILSDILMSGVRIAQKCCTINISKFN